MSGFDKTKIKMFGILNSSCWDTFPRRNFRNLYSDQYFFLPYVHWLPITTEIIDASTHFRQPALVYPGFSTCTIIGGHADMKHAQVSATDRLKNKVNVIYPLCLWHCVERTSICSWFILCFQNPIFNPYQVAQCSHPLSSSESATLSLPKSELEACVLTQPNPTQPNTPLPPRCQPIGPKVPRRHKRQGDRFSNSH